ncbi:hypothetical protein C8R47DRAFT_1143248 [Mycena vitilis]|nr:hypothetical protein C8R47DRAFT_1143248 [Mycena vitilis]
MGVLAIFYGPASKNAPVPTDTALASSQPASTTVPSEAEREPSLGSAQSASPEASIARRSEDKPPVTRRLTFRPFAPVSQHKPILSEDQEHEKRASAANAFSKRWSKPLSSNSDKRAKESALVVRTLIVGPSSNDYAKPTITKAVAKPQLSKVKSQLMQPNSANRVIAQLRALPVIDDAAVDGKDANPLPRGPIHAVCLAHPDAEEHDLHFAKLTADNHEQSSNSVPNVASASLERLTNMFSEMHVVDLITAPDWGIGQPGDGPGLLAGAVPTAETVVNGLEQITPQLMALGYATGRAVLPDHKGVHPPTDRISVLTYWWGLEIVLPSPTLAYLSNTQSIAGTLVNFLTAISLINSGVREILPFVRYISQFIDFEFNAIKKQDKGQGVVCASTWIMPAALVPRPWDFPPPDPAAALSEEDTDLKRNGDEPSPSTTNVNPPPLIPDPASSVPLPALSPTPDTPLFTTPSIPHANPSSDAAAVSPGRPRE